MARIVVFDSGLGSLSIIQAIQKQTKCEIIYYADQKNFPYGKKSVPTLRKIIQQSIKSLDDMFKPDLIVIASNTPSLLLHKLYKNNNKIISVLPPIKQAKKFSKQTICILATQSVVSSNSFQEYINEYNTSKINIISINSSPLVELVESGKIFSAKNYCQVKIKKTLTKYFEKNNVDVATLSSTHLPFLKPMLEKLYPEILFLDPADTIAKEISKKISQNKSSRNSLKIFSSGNIVQFQKKLTELKIKNHIKRLVI